MNSMKKNQVATLAGGCFWCIEGAFSNVKGIIKATSGYMGGIIESPSYEQICSGDTGHAEVVQLHFDVDMISYKDILEIFFTLHNPTQLDRQGNDIGSQYRSEIFIHNHAQEEIAEEIIAKIIQGELFEDDIVTKISPAVTFYSAEDEHQNYFKNNPRNQYCQAIIAPKLAKFRKTFVEKLK